MATLKTKMIHKNPKTSLTLFKFPQKFNQNIDKSFFFNLFLDFNYYIQL